ncbi:MAG: hypothetical protein GF365_00300 [Candidatus Buchananbacteria bacterium]|nr:hypothetical protein [Candidatus Buchananbacteria bacterium]
MIYKSAFKISFLFLLLCFLVACGPAKKPPSGSNNGTGTFNTGGQPNTAPLPVTAPVPEPAPAPVPNPGPVNGLVTITVSAGRNLSYAVTDIGYGKHYASGGTITFQITPGDHAINATDKDWNFAVSDNQANYPLYVNGVKLSRVRPDPKGGMYYFFVYSDGSISSTPP